MHEGEGGEAQECCFLSLVPISAPSDFPLYPLYHTIPYHTIPVPYEIVFGRTPCLPIDVTFGTHEGDQVTDVVSPQDYLEELEFSLSDVFDQVAEKLN